ncbi:MAG: aminomethyl-transferring glycine dehydrogenase subunit GcvPB, partial [Sulfolobales archaeon]
MWSQAKWDEPLIFELGGRGRIGLLINQDDKIREEVGEIKIPDTVRRKKEPELPELSELEVVRHYIRLSQMSFGVDTGFIPLGSCTMKYNPKIQERVSSFAEDLHPLQDSETVQGILEVIYEMQNILAEITGMEECSLQVPAGSAGELAGVLMIKKYHEDQKRNRDEILVADTAHGTNPASASMAGFKVVYVKSNNEGLVDIDLLKQLITEKTAGFMLTNPNTLGLFEENILEISRIIHEVDGVLYYDGANLNGILGVTRPGDMGFDIVHLNLHKTFGVPHGGGGPGAGAICAKGKLKDYLPYPLVEKKNGKFYLTRIPSRSIGKIAVFHGNIGNVIRAYAYILGLGSEGLSKIGILSTIATNYIFSQIKNLKGIDIISPNRPRKHEIAISLKPLMEETGVTAFDVAKALLDKGIYAPTIYFPIIIPEVMLIEPTETEPLEILDEFISAFKEIIEESYKNPEKIKNSPQ